MCHQTGVDKIYLYVKDPYEAIKLSLNIWMMFIKILKNTIQTRQTKYWLCLMIWLLICLVMKNLIQ